MSLIRLRADFNGLFGDLLRLSHSDVAIDEGGKEIVLSQGAPRPGLRVGSR